MTKQSRTLIATGVLLLSAALPFASIGVETTMDAAQMEQMITTAATTTDHEALAAQYETEAGSSLKLAEHHRAMARAYETLAAGNNKGGAAAFVEHCRKLIAKYEEAAAEYTALAQLHRDLAAQMAAL